MGADVESNHGEQSTKLGLGRTLVRTFHHSMRRNRHATDTAVCSVGTGVDVGCNNDKYLTNYRPGRASSHSLPPVVGSGGQACHKVL